MKSTSKLLIICISLLLLTSTVSAEGGFWDFLFGPSETQAPAIDLSKVNETESFIDGNTGTHVKITYEGIAIKNKSKFIPEALVVKEETEKVLKNTTFPYQIKKDKTNLTIEKFRCRADYCGYWISATRNGYEVETDSPIWIRNPEYRVVLSETFNETANEYSVTLREDPKGAVEQILQNYVDGQPLGTAIVGRP